MGATVVAVGAARASPRVRVRPSVPQRTSFAVLPCSALTKACSDCTVQATGQSSRQAPRLTSVAAVLEVVLEAVLAVVVVAHLQRSGVWRLCCLL